MLIDGLIFVSFSYNISHIFYKIPDQHGLLVKPRSLLPKDTKQSIILKMTFANKENEAAGGGHEDRQKSVEFKQSATEQMVAQLQEVENRPLEQVENLPTRSRALSSGNMMSPLLNHNINSSESKKQRGFSLNQLAIINGIHLPNSHDQPSPLI